MFKDILQKPEKYRNGMALVLTTIFTFLIFVGFAFYKGYLSFGDGGALAGRQKSVDVASVVLSKSVPSPLQNSKETLGAAFKEIKKQYDGFQNSLSAVLVPFITGIEVYERK